MSIDNERRKHAPTTQRVHRQNPKTPTPDNNPQRIATYNYNYNYNYNMVPGTVVVVGGWEAMRVVGNGDRNEKVWVGFDGSTYTHEGCSFDS